jgi:hypothetical protein
MKGKREERRERKRGRTEGRKGGRKEGREEGRKKGEGKKEGGNIQKKIECICSLSIFTHVSEAVRFSPSVNLCASTHYYKLRNILFSQGHKNQRWHF